MAAIMEGKESGGERFQRVWEGKPNAAERLVKLQVRRGETGVAQVKWG